MTIDDTPMRHTTASTAALPPSVLILGDTHMGLDQIVAADRAWPVGIPFLHVGDLDFTPASAPTWRRLTASLAREFYWCRGNHDLVPMAWRDADEPVPISPQFWYVPDGVVVSAGGLRIGCVGGASSIDRRDREPFGLWDPAERLRPVEVARARAMGAVDLLVTHCPTQAVVQQLGNPQLLQWFGLPADWRDPTADTITDIREALGRPPIVSGHMHARFADPADGAWVVGMSDLMPWPPTAPLADGGAT